MSNPWPGFHEIVAAVSLIAWGSGAAAQRRSDPGTVPLTIHDVRTLPTPLLARRLLGDRLGSRVIEAARHEYDRMDPSMPDYVEFYSQPVRPDPRINRICRTDVITIEYDWPGLDLKALGRATVAVAHVEAMPRYKAFAMPPGAPGSARNEAAQAAACARMTSAADAFRAPSAGDAQWLAAVEEEYADAKSSLPLTCDDFADGSCVSARRALPLLKLSLAAKVERVDCRGYKPGDGYALCYRLSFPRARSKCSDRIDLDGFGCDDFEWVMTAFAAMKMGDSPVRLLSLHLEHRPKPLSLH